MRTKFRPSRHLASAAVLAAGIAAGMALAPTMSIHAQDRGPVPTHLLGTEADVPSEGGLLLRAPLYVVGSDGQMLLEVTDQGMVYYARGVGPENGFAVNYGSTPVIQAYASGESKGSLTANNNGQVTAEIGVGGQSGKGFIILRENGTDMITIGGRYRSLRVLENEQERIVVGDDQGSMGIHAKTKGGLATLGMSGNTFGMFLKDTNGTPTADISQPQGLGMALRAYDSGKQVAAIGNVPGEGGSVRIFAPGSPKAAVSLQTNEAGTGLVHVYGQGGKEAVLLDGEAGTVAVTGDAGSALLGSIDGADPIGFGPLGAGSGSSWGLFLGDQSKQPLAELAQPSGRGMALRVYEGGTQVAAIGSAVGSGGALRIADSAGNAAATITVDGDGGLAQVYRAGQPVAALVAKDAAVAVYNASGIPVASLSLSSNQQGGNVTTRDGSGMGVFSAGAATDGGGEACVNRIRGDGSPDLACLGVGLPGMGQGK